MNDELWSGLAIRPSMTSSYADCNLRGLVKAYPALFTHFGYKLNQTTPSLAAAIGTGVHAGAAMMLVRKMGMGDVGPPEEAETRAVEIMRTEAENGFLADDTSPTLNIAEQQVLRMTRCYREHVAPTISPIAVETRVEADAGDGFHVSGQADVIALQPGGIDDTKTGVMQRSAIVQVGTYSRIYRSHGYEVNWLSQTFIQRVRLKDAQPLPENVQYPVALAERLSELRIAEIKRDVIELCRTGDPLVVSANPGSILCSAKWCPAHSTSTCRQWKGAS